MVLFANQAGFDENSQVAASTTSATRTMRTRLTLIAVRNILEDLFSSLASATVQRRSPTLPSFDRVPGQASLMLTLPATCSVYGHGLRGLGGVVAGAAREAALEPLGPGHWGSLLQDCCNRALSGRVLIEHDSRSRHPDRVGAGVRCRCCPRGDRLGAAYRDRAPGRGRLGGVAEASRGETLVVIGQDRSAGGPGMRLASGGTFGGSGASARQYR